MNKDSDFFFVPEDKDEFPGLYGIYIRGVNCTAGKEKPIGTIYIPDAREKYDKIIKIRIFEVDLTADKYIELFEEIRKQLNIDNYTDIRFTA